VGGLLLRGDRLGHEDPELPLRLARTLELRLQELQVLGQLLSLPFLPVQLR